MAKKKDKLNWAFEGQTFTVGNAINEEWSAKLHRDKNNTPVVFYEGKIYLLGHRTYPKVYIHDIWLQKKGYWTTQDKVFQVLKLS
jgi:hypothetical protein